MRFVFGIIVGVLLAVGGAYVHDAAIDPTRPDSGRQMVNWDVVDGTLRGVNDWLSAQWTSLTRNLHAPG